MDMNRDIEHENHIERMRNMEQWVFNTICPNLARQKEEFLDELEEIFEPAIELAKQEKKFRWKFVKTFYNTYKSELTDLWSLRIFCTFTVKLFYMFDCEDHQLVQKIIFMYSEVLKLYAKLGLCENCKRENNPKHYHYEDLEDPRTILKSVNKITKDSFNGKFYTELTMNAINEGEYVLLRFLRKYGLSHLVLSGMNQIIESELLELYDNYHILRRLHGNKNEREDFPVSTLNKLFMDIKEPNIKRTFLIVRYVNICLDKRLNEKYYPDYANCLNLYVETLPEPAISLENVREFLELIFNNDIDLVTGVCSDFKEVFPENPNISSPRSLKYLCRCAVRDYIQKHPSLPAVLSNIQIPWNLKDYLLFLSD